MVELRSKSKSKAQSERDKSMVGFLNVVEQRTRQYKASKLERWFTIQSQKVLGREGEDMENWKRAVVAGSAGAATILLLKGKRPAGVLVAGVGLAVLASEYPEKFAQIREEIPSYVRQGTRFIDLAMKIGTKIGDLLERRAAGLMPELEEH